MEYKNSLVDGINSTEIRDMLRYRENTASRAMFTRASILLTLADFTKLKKIINDEMPTARSIPDDMKSISITYQGKISVFAKTLSAVIINQTPNTRCRTPINPLKPMPFILSIYFPS